MEAAATGIRIRPAEPGDYDAYAHLYPQLLAPAVMHLRETWVRVDQPYSFVAEIAGLVVGYARWDASGHVVHLVVDEPWRRCGVGERLLRAVAKLLRRRGLETWTINVKEKNRPAIQLYEKLGFRPKLLEYELRVSWKSIRRLPREKRRFKAYRVRPRGHALIEKILRMDLDEFHLRAPDNVVVALHLPAGGLVGACAFSPSFATVEEIWLFGEARAAPLLEVVARFREPDDEAFLIRLPYGPLYKVLRRNGAMQVLSLLHMHGVIPAGEPVLTTPSDA